MVNTRLQDLLAKEDRDKKSQPTAGRKRHDRFGTTGSVKFQVKRTPFFSLPQTVDPIHKAILFNIHHLTL